MKNVVNIYQQRGFWEHNTHQVPYSCLESLPIEQQNNTYISHIICKCRLLNIKSMKALFIKIT